MKIKTKDLTGAALDWAVAKAVQLPIYQCGEGWPGNHVVNEESLRHPVVTVGLTGRMLLEGPKTSENKEWSPSTDWAQSGPIIERGLISISPYHYSDDGWRASIMRPEVHFTAYGDTPLVAAMGCYVLSEIGEAVDIPKGLK